LVYFGLTTNGNLLEGTNPFEQSIQIELEAPKRLEGGKKLPLVVCIAPMYTVL
jgi:hypothetical protein